MIAGAAAISALGSCKEASPEHMNIVYIMCDDHSYQTISAYDDRYMKTPGIDRLSEEGYRFTNSFVANSLSGPSRACLLTGMHSHANGYTDNGSGSFDGSQSTFPKILQQHGYQTAIVGKWHLGSEPTGFDYWDILMGQGEYYQPVFICNRDTLLRPGYVTEVITDRAIEWMDRTETSRNLSAFSFITKPLTARGCLTLKTLEVMTTWNSLFQKHSMTTIRDVRLLNFRK